MYVNESFAKSEWHKYDIPSRCIYIKDGKLTWKKGDKKNEKTKA